MKTQANGIGGYKRKTSPSGTTRISAESRARIEQAHALCRERANTGKTPAAAAAVYEDNQAGLPVSVAEAQV